MKNAYLCELFLKHTTKLDILDSQGYTALQVAVKNTFINGCIKLVAKGSEVNYVNIEGLTALTLAI